MNAILNKPERKTLPSHVNQETRITLSKEARNAMGRYVERRRLVGEALPPDDDLFDRPVYRTGDGDPHPYVPRPGSMVAYSLPSRGIGA